MEKNYQKWGMKMNKIKRKKINNCWFWLMLFLIFIILTFIILAVSNSRLQQLWNFWGWYLVLGILISLLAISIVLFIRRYRNINNSQKLKYLVDKRRKFGK